MAAHAVAAGRVGPHCHFRGCVAPDACLAVALEGHLTMLYLVRIVTCGAAKLPAACKKTLRLAQPVDRIHNLEFRFPARPWSVIERELEGAQGLPRMVGKRSAVEAAEYVRQRC